MPDIPLSTLLFLLALLLVVGALCAFTLRPVRSKRGSTVEIEITDEFPEQCPHCRALPLKGYLGDDCWSCGHELAAVVPARPNQDEAS